jgi:bifunctional DNA-binding transcriptional regulator/antitoxin component of YhaV-PrlF toxin-antitoxin module
MTVSTRGRITLPAELRRLDAIEAGQRFEMERIGPGHYLLVRQPADRRGLVDWLAACPEKGFFIALGSESTDSLASQESRK